MNTTPYSATICIEGTKGAGKSTTIRNLVNYLEADGWFVSVCAPFAQGNIRARKLGWTGISEMAESGSVNNLQAVTMLTEIMDDAATQFASESAASGKSRNLLIYDRGLMTLHTYCFDLGFASSHYGSKAGLDFWQDNFPKYLHPTFFIHTRPEISHERRQGQLGPVCGIRGLEDLQRDYGKRHRLIRSAPFAQCLAGAFETGNEAFRDCAAEIVERLPSLLHPILIPGARRPATVRSRRGKKALAIEQGS